jgi:hypothetical protein
VGDPVTLEARGAQRELYRYGEVVSFAAGGGSERFRASGWANTEQRFTWTLGDSASLIVPVEPSKNPVDLEMKIGGIRNPPKFTAQPVEVLVNGEHIAHWEVAEVKVYTARIPQRLVAAPGALAIEFQIPKAFSPASAGHSADRRKLGLQCWEMVLRKAR